MTSSLPSLPSLPILPILPSLPILLSIAISYELSRDAMEVAADPSAWSLALTAELEARFPGCAVRVVSFWASADASRYDIAATTGDGHQIAGSKAHWGGAEIYDAASEQDTPYAHLREIARRIDDANLDAWDRVCAGVAS